MMSDIEWKENAVCAAAGLQFFAPVNGMYPVINGTGLAGEDYFNRPDTTINEPRIGDYIEKSELNTEQKYNDVVEVFGLFGFPRSECSSGYYWLKFEWDCIELHDGRVVNSSDLSGRKLTYSQLMAIGKLKRMMNEREAAKGEWPSVGDSFQHKESKVKGIILGVSGDFAWCKYQGMNPVTIDIRDINKPETPEEELFDNFWREVNLFMNTSNIDKKIFKSAFINNITKKPQ